jgi:hypothetical protein
MRQPEVCKHQVSRSLWRAFRHGDASLHRLVRIDRGQNGGRSEGRRRLLAVRARPLAEIVPMTRSQRSVHRALWPVLALTASDTKTRPLNQAPPVRSSFG